MLTESQKRRVLTGLKCEEYSELINSLIQDFPGSGSVSKGKYELLRLNQARIRRIDSTFQPDEKIKEIISGIEKKQTWLVLTEPWCGDSAQNIPYIKNISGLNPLINFRLLFRDENPDIMDLYLTGESRSIPILVSFDDQWNELFRWGSRPKTAAILVKELKNSGSDKTEIEQKLHKWYAINRGEEVCSEICEVLRNVLTPEML
jgi:hypothetical protein